MSAKPFCQVARLRSDRLAWHKCRFLKCDRAGHVSCTHRDGVRMVERRAISVVGIVQGVGFRPFVHGLASRLHLQGFVRNQSGEVRVEVEGERGLLDCFLNELTLNPPPLAHIDRVSWSELSPCGDAQFRIDASESDPDGQVLISPDVATCSDCLGELLDPTNRRYRYPFLNCTNCGPRLTIIIGSPYDWPRTTMAGFAMCAECNEEYDNPADRRFHAQPTCCRECGPTLRLLNGVGTPLAAEDPLRAFVEGIQGGHLGRLKGVGGYHLVCDATREPVVAELRRRKHRYEKPFAVMVPDLPSVRAICEVSPLEATLLQSPRAPIVLLQRRSDCGIADSVAGQSALGRHVAVHAAASPVDARRPGPSVGNDQRQPLR